MTTATNTEIHLLESPPEVILYDLHNGRITTTSGTISIRDDKDVKDATTTTHRNKEIIHIETPPIQEVISYDLHNGTTTSTIQNHYGDKECTAFPPPVSPIAVGNDGGNDFTFDIYIDNSYDFDDDVSHIFDNYDEEWEESKESQ